MEDCALKFKPFIVIPAIISCFLLLIPLDVRVLAAEEQKTPAVEEKVEPLIGTVDLAVVYSFHPLMQYYNHDLGLFLKPFKGENQSYEKLLSLIEARNKEYKAAKDAVAPEIKRLKTEYDEINRQISKVESICVFEASSANDKMLQEAAAAKSDSEKDEISRKYRKKTFDIQKKLEAETAALKSKLSEITVSNDRIFNSLLELHYLNRENSDKLLSDINSEIREALSYAAKKTNVRAIMNVGAMEIRKPDYMEMSPALPAAAVPAKPRDAEGIVPDYNPILSMLRNFEYKPDSVHNPKNIRNIFMNSTFIPLLENNRKMTKIKGVINDPILFGNTDLTPMVVIYLMAKNGISREKAELLLDFFNSADRKPQK